jgi:AcrR family transcriptional regulator
MTPDEATAQARAREYFRSKAALAPAAIREQIDAAYRSLEAVLTEVPAARAGVRAIPEEWSVQEIADHLLETYRPGVDELRCVLAGQRPPGEPIPAALQSKAPRLRPWPWLLAELRRVHESVLELVSGVAADFTTDARVPIVMVVNVTGADGRVHPLHWVEDLEWKAYALVSWRLHAIDHLNQTRKVLAAAR